MLSLTILTLPWSSLAISSSAGAICRQGPHHSAQKSTTTGVEDLSTSDSKVSSESAEVAIFFSWFAGNRPHKWLISSSIWNLGAHLENVKAAAPPVRFAVRPNQAVLMGCA